MRPLIRYNRQVAHKEHYFLRCGAVIVGGIRFTGERVRSQPMTGRRRCLRPSGAVLSDAHAGSAFRRFPQTPEVSGSGDHSVLQKTGTAASERLTRPMPKCPFGGFAASRLGIGEVFSPISTRMPSRESGNSDSVFLIVLQGCKRKSSSRPDIVRRLDPPVRKRRHREGGRRMPYGVCRLRSAGSRPGEALKRSSF